MIKVSSKTILLVYAWAQIHKIEVNADKFSLMTFEEGHNNLVRTEYSAPGGWNHCKEKRSKGPWSADGEYTGFCVQIESMVKKARKKVG